MSEDKLPTDGVVDPAADPGGADDELLRRAAHEVRASTALQALVPLSATEREQLADAAFERTLGATTPVGVPPLRPRLRARSVGLVAAAAVALAAVVALALLGRGTTVPPLAKYAMVVEGEQHVRGVAASDAVAPVELRPDTRVTMRLTSPKPERDALLRLVLVRLGRAMLLDPPVARGKAGSLSIEARAGELLGAQVDGPAELVVVLGRALPSDDEIRALALGTAGPPPPHLQILRRAIVLASFSHGAIDVLLGGCRAVLEAPGTRPRCEIAPGTALHLWIGVPATTALTLALDGRPVAPPPRARDGGTAFELEVPARAGVLTVHLDTRELAAWELAPAATFAKVRAAEAARLAGRLDDADAELDGIAADASAEEQLEAVRWRAKIAYRRGDAGKVRAWRERAVALARSLGRVSVEADELVAVIYGLRNDHALTQAVQLLPALDAHTTSYAEGAVRRDLVHGLLASDLGDLGAALGSFQRALAIADRIADTTDRDALLGPLADVLQALGRDGEVRALIDAELQRGADDVDVCARVDAVTNAGWLLRDIEPARALALAEQAAAQAATSCAYRVPLTLVNQGWLLAAARRFDEARAIVDRIALARGTHDGLVTTWALRLEAETVLGEDPASAERYAQPLATRAATLCSTELAYEAALLRARALVSLAHAAEATAAFADAERALTLWSHLVPLGEGRATFFQRHDQLALTAIPFLLAQARAGAPGAKLALAAMVRRSLARFVGSLAGGGRAHARAQRGASDRDDASRRFEQTIDRWPARLAADTPGEPVPGVCAARDAVARDAREPALTEPPPHAALLVHPAPHGWLVIAWRGSSIELREVARAGDREAPAALSARLATAAAPLLAGAPRVHLHVHRSLAGLPLDRDLAARLAVPIAFAVDAPRPRPGAPCAGPRRALLVTNPENNLWQASDAAPAIRGDLDRMGLAVDVITGGAATRAAIEERLADPCTALFHYDGHGLSAAQRGRSTGPAADRSEDALALADGDTLTAAEVLELPRVPVAVVLNGCTTAAPEGLGLAQAFLLAGAAQVIASLDEVPADAAAQFTRTLFSGSRDAGGGPALDPPAVDLVQLFARVVSGADVPALRVYER